MSVLGCTWQHNLLIQVACQVIPMSWDKYAVGGSSSVMMVVDLGGYIEFTTADTKTQCNNGCAVAWATSASLMAGVSNITKSMKVR